MLACRASGLGLKLPQTPLKMKRWLLHSFYPPFMSSNAPSA